MPRQPRGSEDFEELLSMFDSSGTRELDSPRSKSPEKLALEKSIRMKSAQGSEDRELDLSPGSLDKTNDPVRMYLREMGVVPLLTRKGKWELPSASNAGRWMYGRRCPALLW